MILREELDRHEKDLEALAQQVHEIVEENNKVEHIIRKMSMIL